MKNRARLFSVFALVPVAALTLAACSAGTAAEQSGGEVSPAESVELTKLTVGVTGIAADGALLAGVEQGFFEDEGLEVEATIIANPPAGLAAVQGGQLDLTFTPSVPLLNAMSQGIPLQVVGNATGFPEGALASGDATEFDDSGLYAGAASGITSVKELEGKTVAVLARKGQFEVIVSSALSNAGVDPASVNWVALDFASATEALKNGTVDAAALAVPFSRQAEAAGAVKISSPAIEFVEEGALAFWATSASTAEQKTSAMAAFQRAIAKANAWANTNTSTALQVGLDAIDSPLSVNQISSVYWPEKLNIADLERANEKMVKLGFLAQPVNLDGVILQVK